MQLRPSEAVDLFFSNLCRPADSCPSETVASCSGEPTSASLSGCGLFAVPQVQVGLAGIHGIVRAPHHSPRLLLGGGALGGEPPQLLLPGGGGVDGFGLVGGVQDGLAPQQLWLPLALAHLCAPRERGCGRGVLRLRGGSAWLTMISSGTFSLGNWGLMSFLEEERGRQWGGLSRFKR